MIRALAHSVVRRLVGVAVVALVPLAIPSGLASAGVPLAPLRSIHPTAMPSSRLKSQDSCSLSQFSNPKLPMRARVDLRGFRVNLISPVMWNCGITDGNGSGAAVSVSYPSVRPNPTRNSILLISSANVQDNGGDFCAYTDTAMPSWEKVQCRGRTHHPGDEEVKYLFGGPHSKTMVVLVAVPSGVVTPWTGIPAVRPTVVVLASSSTHQGAFDLVCSVGTTLSAMCITDAHQFAAAYRSQL
jgi:hypothetical protein